ncbi:SDR family NAD(P)-dependent oxidoreductase [Actinacidiphila soli]|uniref:SDR family NAD(P)-dependent oxidoreductase n=1 Tax=Actinacidiphila soli TaxID=2487275 RepID=UPI003898FC15
MGGVLNVASTSAFQPSPYPAVYGASKTFVLTFSQALRAETRGSGVAVVALRPGPTRTGFVAALDADVTQTRVYQGYLLRLVGRFQRPLHRRRGDGHDGEPRRDRRRFRRDRLCETRRTTDQSLTACCAAPDSHC